MNSEIRILIVDDSPATLEVLARNLGGSGRVVTTADGVHQAREALARGKFDLVVTDLRMPDGDGHDLIRHIRTNLPDTEVMMITGYATIQGAVDAMKTGAAEYLAKPFTRDELLEAVKRSLDRLQATRRTRLEGQANRFGLIGESEPMLRLLAGMERLLDRRVTVLFSGEPGSGRSTAARAFAAVARPGAPIVETTITGLIDPEAVVGLRQRAAGGTLILTDVTWAPRPEQEALLRGLAGGGPESARLLTVSEPELAGLAAAGAVSGRLYELLCEATVTVPPLRDRGPDIVRLAEYFATRLPAQAGRALGGPAFAESARAALRAWNWPGNIPELRGVVAHALLGASAWPIEREHLPESLAGEATSALRTLADVELTHIRRVLATVGGNKSRAAEILGINRKTLGDKLRSRAGDPA